MNYGTCCAQKLHAKSRLNHKITSNEGAFRLAELDNSNSVRGAREHKRCFLAFPCRTTVCISVAGRFGARRTR
jgi:hypothetical protein